ncbi:mitochondrial ATPase inhibitor, IATP-domain-containing protein [Biscogniauxia marginata]|nr:mitochondrial ATPase inhibitor, IATP-domain-containing protein [Biscogniauxia marginata]
MYRQALIKVPSRRAFSMTARAMASGDTGAPPKTGGPGDAFQKREKANEDFVIRQREREKLQELKKRLVEQQHNLKKLSDHIDELTGHDDATRNKF